MLHFMRRSLMFQLLRVYLLFVVIVLIGGVGVDAVVEQQVRNGVQASDQALAQDIALETSLQLSDAEHSLVALSKLAAQARTPAAMESLFYAFQSTRNDVNYVYWLDPVGDLRVSWPAAGITLGAEFSPPEVVQRVRMAYSPVFEIGVSVEVAFNAGVIIAEPVRDAHNKLLGIVATSLSLDELSEPLGAVVQAQQHQGRQLKISIIDNQGVLIGTPEHKRILQTVLDELPGATQALQGHVVSRLGPWLDGQDWLFSAVPVPDAGWAVVVQRPANEALAVVTQFRLWLFGA